MDRAWTTRQRERTERWHAVGDNPSLVQQRNEAIEPVLALPPEQRINGIVKTVNHVHSVLSEVPAPASTALQQRIETFTRSPLQALPR